MDDVVAALVAAKKLNPEIGYIAQRIYLPCKVGKSSGPYDYVGLQSLSAAQKNRNAATDLTRNVMASLSDTFATDKIEKRHIIPERQVQTFGGLDVADEVGVTSSTSIVMDQHEEDAAALLFGLCNAATNLYALPAAATGGVFAKIQQISGLIRKYFGNRTLICSETWFANFIARADILDLLKSTMGLTATQELIQKFNNTSAGIQIFMGGQFPIPQILIGDDRFFMRDGLEDIAAIVKIPALPPNPSIADVMSLIARLPVFGLGFWNLPDPEDPTIMFQVEAAWDNGCKANAYDATGEYALKHLNAGAAKFIQLPNFVETLTPGTTTTTTSTTTTTTTTAG
jgi:hypothetical protein